MPRCPRCNYVWDEPVLIYGGFVKQLVHENIEYKCDFCGKVVHEAYARRNESWSDLGREKYLACKPEKTYVCLDCLYKYAPEELLEQDRLNKEVNK